MSKRSVINDFISLKLSEHIFLIISTLTNISILLKIS